MERILLEAEAEENAIPEGNLVNWVSYSAIVFTIGLFSSGMSVFLLQLILALNIDGLL